jgi:hypothetical protein
VFIEKIVKKRKTAYDYLSTIGLIFLGIIIIIGITFVDILYNFVFLAAVGVAFGIYQFMKYNNVEFEYSVLNGDIDIDRILGMSRRKRIFSASCREFEVFAPLESPLHAGAAAKYRNVLYAVTSMKDPGIYFFAASYNDKKTLVYFQPDERMLNNFAIYNPNVMSRAK